jgi:flagellar hook-associated protein FlgK
MTLGLALGNALTGLRASQSAFGVLSHNIANVNNPDHSRQIVAQSAVYVEGVGSGVRIDDVIRNIDSFLRRSILNQNAVSARTDVIDAFHGRIQILLGEPGAQNSLDEGITTFYNNLSLLSETPERASFRSNAINGAIDLSRQVSDLSFRLEDLRFEADRQISETVNSINGNLRRLEQINVALSSAASLGNSRAGLEDERDALLKDLASDLDITTFFEETGAVNVFTGNGVALVDNVRRELSYNGVPSGEIFAQDGVLSALQLTAFNTSGEPLGDPVELISSGTRGNITTILNGGNLLGLQQIRDEIIPEFLSQLDTLAGSLRDTVNAVHNLGTAFPPPNNLTGTRSVRAGDQFDWQGSIRIAALTANGDPIRSVYNDESDTAFRPLTLNLGTLDSGFGAGKPTVQGIIDEINNHFRAPPPKVTIGNLNNIQLASSQNALPSSPIPQFQFDLDIENISNSASNVFVTGFTVLDDGAVDITNVTQDVPRFALDSLNTFTTTAGSNDVVVRTTLPNGVGVGDTIFLSAPPPGLYNGIPDTELTGYFTVKAVSGNDVTIEVASLAVAGPAIGVAGLTLSPSYSRSEPGSKARTTGDGSIALDLTANVLSNFYDISVDIGVLEADGTISTSTITYRVNNNTQNVRNERYNNTSVAGNASRILPNTNQEGMRAILVDEDGNELSKINGVYPADTPGFLSITGGSADFRVAIEDLGSSQRGRLDISPQEPGTNRAFSHYFELNNLFASNNPTATGDTLTGSAFNFALEQRVIDDPNLITTGRLELSAQPSDPNARAQYTYTLFSGNNENAQALSESGLNNVSFAAAGGLPQTQLTFGAYVGEILGFISSQAVQAQNENTTAQTLLSGFVERAQATSSVNLDEELANTIIYQNSYSAAARVIAVVDELFNDLLQIA